MIGAKMKQVLQIAKKHILVSTLFLSGMTAVVGGVAVSNVGAAVSASSTAPINSLYHRYQYKSRHLIGFESGVSRPAGGCTYENHLISCTAGRGNMGMPFPPEPPMHPGYPNMPFPPEPPMHPGYPNMPFPSTSTTCQAASSGDAVPTARAVVSIKMTQYGPVLAVGSGSNVNCSLYTLTADNTAASPATYGCTDTPVVPNLGSCAQNIWPALLSDGTPVAGMGVNPHLLGIVKRTDVISGKTVDQVTYNGHPLYQFFLDKKSNDLNGAGLNDGLAGGVWYLMSPMGIPAAGHATVTLEGTTNAGVVLSVLMNTGAGYKEYPVYTFSGDANGKVSCTGKCAQFWPPVLTSEFPIATNGVNQMLLGVTRNSAGSLQVTYNGHPLYLFIKDAAISAAGEATGNGLGALFGGTFETVNPATPVTSSTTTTTAAPTTTTAAPTTTTAAPTTTTAAPTTTTNLYG